MNREIKFRVWDGEYFMMPDLTFDDECFIALYGQLRHVYEQGGYYSSKDTQALKGEHIIEQFTGLKDKNGVEIYEGDICNTSYFKNGKVVMWNYSFCFEVQKGEHHSFNTAAHSIEVIGNIHQNPELLCN